MLQQTPPSKFGDFLGLEGSGLPLPLRFPISMMKEAVNFDSNVPLPFRVMSKTPVGSMSGKVADLFDLPAKGYPAPLRMMAQLFGSGSGSDRGKRNKYLPND
jgi:hypothetical protein